MSDFVFINDYKFSLGVRELAIVNGTGQILLTIDENWTGSVYPRSDGEVAAGVDFGSSAGDIVNSALPPGDVRRYGAVAGEAATATTSVNTVAIQAALDSNGYVWLQPGATYMCGPVHVWSNTIVNFNSGTLKLLAYQPRWANTIAVTPRTPDWNFYNESRETAITNVQIINGTVDGNVTNQVQWSGVSYGGTEYMCILAHTSDANNGPGTAGGATYWKVQVGRLGAAWGAGNSYTAGPPTSLYTRSGKPQAGIWIEGETTNVQVNNMVCQNYLFDGVELRGRDDGDQTPENEPNNIRFTDCDFNGNGRQGVSVTAGWDFSFIRCKFRNTTGPTRGGQAPGAGCDLEPNWGGWYDGYPTETSQPVVSDVFFSDCEFTGNGSAGLLMMAGGTERVCTFNRINVRGCKFKDNIVGSYFANIYVAIDGDTGLNHTGAVKALNITDCDFYDHGITLGSGDQRRPPVDAQINQCRFYNAKIGMSDTGAGSLIRINDCYINNENSGTSSGAITSTNMQDGILEINNCNITNSIGNGLYLLNESGSSSGAEVIINGCVINTGLLGVHSQVGDGGTLRVGSGTVIRNSQSLGGIYSVGVGAYVTDNQVILGDVTLEDCLVGITVYQQTGSPNLKLQGTQFVNCTTEFAQNADGPTLISSMVGKGSPPAMAAPNGSTYQSSTGGVFYIMSTTWKVPTLT